MDIYYTGTLKPSKVGIIGGGRSLRIVRSLFKNNSVRKNCSYRRLNGLFKVANWYHKQTCKLWNKLWLVSFSYKTLISVKKVDRDIYFFYTNIICNKLKNVS